MKLQEIKDQVAKDMGFDLTTNVYKIHFSDYTNEIAKRYATECVKASLERAADNAKTGLTKTGIVVDKSSITNPDNIVLF